MGRKPKNEAEKHIKSVYDKTVNRLAQVDADLQMNPSDMVYAALIGRKYAYLEVLEIIEGEWLADGNERFRKQSRRVSHKVLPEA